jgi:serine/threonine protein phosphatase 1
MRLGDTRTPEGMRLYAIGDVHGCDVLLAEMHEKIGEDLARSPVADHRIVHLGDYADRGDDTAAVVERLVRMTEADSRVVCLKGNHDALFVGFLTDPMEHGPTWLANGGDATLRSYGVTPSRSFFGGFDFRRLSERLAEALPATHRSFLLNLPLMARFGDYLFVHAGIRPGVPLESQDPLDLIWIREDFLWDASDHGFVVVHGHTPVIAPEIRPNRIDIDTGAVYGRFLTCLALEGTDYRFL